MPPRRPEHAPSRPETPSRRSQDASKTPTRPPKRPPRQPKTPPDAPKTPPRHPQKTLQDARNTPQDGPKTSSKRLLHDPLLHLMPKRYEHVLFPGFSRTLSALSSRIYFLMLLSRLISWPCRTLHAHTSRMYHSSRSVLQRCERRHWPKAFTICVNHDVDQKK